MTEIDEELLIFLLSIIGMFVCVSNPLLNSHVIRFLASSISRALNTPLAMTDYQRKNNDQQMRQLLSAKSDEEVELKH